MYSIFTERVPDTAGQIWLLEAKCDVEPDAIEPRKECWVLQYKASATFSIEQLVEKNILSPENDNRLIELLEGQSVKMSSPPRTLRFRDFQSAKKSWMTILEKTRLNFARLNFSALKRKSAIDAIEAKCTFGESSLFMSGGTNEGL